MGRPRSTRATVDDVADWDVNKLDEAPIPAGTNTHDHSMFVRLADGSRLRIDRDFAEQAYQAVVDRGVTYWRSPPELMRACIGIGVHFLTQEKGLSNPKLDAMILLDQAEAEIAWRETVGYRLQHLRDSGQNELADKIEHMIGGHGDGGDEVG